LRQAAAFDTDRLMRRAVLILCLLIAPAQPGCKVMGWLLEAFQTDPELEAQIEQDKLEAELIKEYGR
jgi:hypothetical protein